MKIITTEELTEILESHKMWLVKEEGGERANLDDVDLEGVDLEG